jgi:hypothetical protein
MLRGLSISSIIPVKSAQRSIGTFGVAGTKVIGTTLSNVKGSRDSQVMLTASTLGQQASWRHDTHLASATARPTMSGDR